MKAQLLIPAAGMGTRLDLNQPKALLDLCGKPLLIHTLGRFHETGLLEHTVVIVVPPQVHAPFDAVLAAWMPTLRYVLVDGGRERQLSVANGLAKLDVDTGIVAIHDAARPFVGAAAVSASIDAAATYGAATVAIPSIDTILVADADECLESTPDRSRLWACQTPQTFRVEVIREAHRYAEEHQVLGTDDATLVRTMGKPVKLVQGSYLNFKITTPSDVALAESVIERGLV